MLATIEAGASSAVTIARALADFQSLGDNCEFGIVQRYAGIEPLGLLRFAYVPLPALISGLDTDFSSYGAPGDLEILGGHFDTLTCHSRSCGFIYNTGERAGTVDPAILLARHERKVAYLKRLFLEELASGEKILVRKSPPGETLDDVRAIARAVRRHGPSTVLRVEEAAGDAAGDAAPGSVRWCGESLMLGSVRRFSPYEGGMVIDLEPWIALCRNALWLAQDRSGQPPPLDTTSRPIRMQGKAALHVTEPDEAGATIRTFDHGTDLKPDTIYVFSLWVWLPRDFAAQEVHAVFGRLRLAWHGADPGLRETWQRVWISIRTPAEPPRLRVGFGVRGPGGQRFWSTDWRLDEGPVPAAGPAPTIGVGSAWSRWLGRWRR